MVLYQVDDTLAANKKRIAAAVRSHGGKDDDVYMALAMAMAETQCCASKDRDCSKDGTPSANYSCFNMNQDMLKMVGWNGAVDLNDEVHLDEAVYFLMVAWHLWGVDSTLNFHRGGRQAFQDGTSYGAKEYRDAMHAVADYLRTHPWNLEDNTRVGFKLEHV